MGEINIYGVYVPILLVQAIVSYGLLLGIRKFCGGFLSEDWLLYPSLFYLCIYAVLLCAVHQLWLLF